ncbi:uncharacterized protein LODBEIA_P34670 [Lodderomyces beijingensis]|uniref:Brl1/Brr6 domain-containing protein n=1 Tax=Lodderomyces beijingensis TaxID=1775926 RepID=A0ABP0ZNI8_9ASCO
MQREFSPITSDGIESASTPLRLGNQSAGQITVSASVDESILVDPVNSEETHELQSIIETHPDLNIASKQGHHLNPVNVAHVMFSPERKARRQQQQSQSQSQSQLYHEMTTPTRPQRQPSSLSPSASSPTTPAAAIGTTIATGPLASSSIFANPYTPYALNLYFQLLVNITLWSFIIYLLWLSVTTIKADINTKVEQFTLQKLDEISRCSKEFSRNKCDSYPRPPVIDHECDLLDQCQNQDPTKFVRSKISFELLAETVNAFFDKVSYKSLAVLALVLLVSITYTSFTIKDFRSDKLKETEVKYEKHEDASSRKKRAIQFAEAKEAVLFEEELDG